MSEPYQMSEAELSSAQRELLIEQHQGKWIYGGDPNDKQAEATFNDWVASRVAFGIKLTALLRGYATAGKPKGAKKSVSKESIQAALSEDLLA